ncbi:MAG: hypothetical protein LBT20_05805 [Clostridiales bacterium]|jgi:DNA polymerase III epsilon subunit-like protein|nr:hypothetical protein [Clostridiales bacterium]
MTKLIAFDVESCNGNPFNGSMCSFGYCLSDTDFNVAEQKDILINPKPKGFNLGRWGEEPVLKLAYPEEAFRKSPRFYDVYAEIERLFSGDTLAVGFAISNDIRYLNNACDLYRLPHISFRYIDVQLLIKLKKLTRNDTGLAAAAAEYGVEIGEHHRSDEDARATLMLLKEYCRIEGRSVAEILGDRTVIAGVNTQKSVAPCLAPLFFDENNGIPLTRKMKRILIDEYCKEVRSGKRDRDGKFKGKTLCLNSKLEDETDLARKLIGAVLKRGGRYTTEAENCNLFVQGDDTNCQRYGKVKKEIENGKRIDTVGVSELIDALGGLPDVVFDDTATLCRIYGKPTDSYTLRK